LARSRFASAVETARDLEVNLQFEAQALERDLHFISDLPLMGAITQSQQNRSTPRQGKPNDATPSIDSLRTPQQWLDRQGELFDGFLSANPSYLMLATCIREDQSIRELVRSERAASGLRPIRVPSQQLKAVITTADETDSDFFTRLRPGSTYLITGDQLPQHIPTQHRSPLVLIGAAGVYDAEGGVFGLNMIELDLAERLKTLIPAIAPDYVNVILADPSGRIFLEYRNGRFVTTTPEGSVVGRFPDFATVFGDLPATLELDDGERFYGTRVRLGSSSTATAELGIVAHIVDVVRSNE
jgi:hypothetical protein